MTKKNLFVVNLKYYMDPVHAEILHDTENYTLHEIKIPIEPICNAMAKKNTAPNLLKSTKKMLEKFPGKADGVIGYDEYPTSTLVPVLNEQCGLNLLSSSSVIKCEHKYWSRLEQKQSIPEHVPNFCLFDPFDSSSYNSIPLKFPFWIKPVKAYSSYLGFKIKNKADLQKGNRYYSKKNMPIYTFL
jgi:hypothetical protein